MESDHLTVFGISLAFSKNLSEVIKGNEGSTSTNTSTAMNGHGLFRIVLLLFISDIKKLFNLIIIFFVGNTMIGPASPLISCKGCEQIQNFF